MPEPVRRDKRYMPGLDGLRALAVLVVIAYHLGFGWAPGGLLGVGVFFTLSGYLITDLLLAHRARGDFRLTSFWLGRARRLLPALFLMLVVVTAWVTAIGPAQPAQFREAVAAAALYVSNWQLIFHHVSYFARFAAPSPLNHLWSLAVEEQFYIVWPFLLLLGLRFVPDRSSLGIRPRLAAVTVVLALSSALAMALLYHPSLDPSRVYYGTDTRACELLAGAALAMVWPSRRLKTDIAAGARRALDGLGVAGLIGIGLLVWRTNEFSPFLYRGGFLLLAISTALVVAALAHPACRLGGVLGAGPLRWIGVRSYGIYLWHFPIIVLTTPGGVADGAEPLREALQVGATLAVAALSWRYVEEPVRHGALGRLWRRLRAGEWRAQAIPRRTWALAVAAFAVLALAIAGLAGVGTAPPGPAFASSTTDSVTVRTGSGAKTVAARDAPSWQSACRAVVHIGDSTSEGLTSRQYLPRRYQRIEARYAHVGATVQHYEISGARSIVETYEGEPNGEEVARRWKRAGYRGCWVLALGTNDSADVYVGSSVDDAARIDRMMKTIGNEPVLWVNVKSLVPSGPYAAENMRHWDEALAHACSRYPNMRIFDWASIVRDGWFIEDGIHFTSPGYEARSLLIARALADAFPASGERTPCVVRESFKPTRRDRVLPAS
jgi:peptidoglycan/LPS O-acetylase OafA/YrhL